MKMSQRDVSGSETTSWSETVSSSCSPGIGGDRVGFDRSRAEVGPCSFRTGSTKAKDGLNPTTGPTEDTDTRPPFSWGRVPILIGMTVRFAPAPGRSGSIRGARVPPGPSLRRDRPLAPAQPLSPWLRSAPARISSFGAGGEAPTRVNLSPDPRPPIPPRQPSQLWLRSAPAQNWVRSALEPRIGFASRGASPGAANPSLDPSHACHPIPPIQPLQPWLRSAPAPNRLRFAPRPNWLVRRRAEWVRFAPA